LPARTIRIRKRDLAIKLQKISPHPKPKVTLEQYTIPADLAAEILFSACYVYGDIDGRRVVDLGTGTGRLAIGAALLNAEYVVAVDVDPLSLTVAAENSKLFGVHVDWVLANAETIRGQVNTVIMNPPFGTRQPHADIKFLNLALEIGEVVYSIHKSSTRRFLSQWIQNRGYEASEILTSKMEIPHQFTFHRKERRFVEVCVIRIRSRSKQ
jgi:putative methylase